MTFFFDQVLNFDQFLKKQFFLDLAIIHHISHISYENIFLPRLIVAS